MRNPRWLGSVAVLSFSSLVAACSPHTPSASAPSDAPAAPSGGLLSPSTAVSSAPSATGAPPASAAPAPATSSTPPAPAKMCGGIAGFRCEDKQYCAFPLQAHCGAGDMAGVCKPIPGLCTMEYAPVCGCDGKTYGSACMAAGKGVSVASSGVCPADDSAGIAEGKPCGTRGVPGDCAKGTYCAFKSQCGATDSGGTCRKKPEICSDLFAAVCGCDGKTYPNACHAERAGVSVAASVACNSAPVK